MRLRLSSSGKRLSRKSSKTIRKMKKLLDFLKVVKLEELYLRNLAENLLENPIRNLAEE